MARLACGRVHSADPAESLWIRLTSILGTQQRLPFSHSPTQHLHPLEPTKPNWGVRLGKEVWAIGSVVMNTGLVLGRRRNRSKCALPAPSNARAQSIAALTPFTQTNAGILRQLMATWMVEHANVSTLQNIASPGLLRTCVETGDGHYLHREYAPACQTLLMVGSLYHPLNTDHTLPPSPAPPPPNTYN